jgi:acyl-CoA thioesterase-1
MKIIWFCASGYSFFIGILLFILAILFSVFYKKSWSEVIVYVFIVIGIFLIFFSATPFALWFYTIWVITLLLWLLVMNLKLSTKRFKWQKTASVLFLLMCITAILIELPYHLKPSIPKRNFDKLYIIGDSVSAGIGGKNEQTWPKILHEKYKVNVINLSESGATVGSALRQADKIESQGAIVLLEIGGNDLFAPTPISAFEKDMRQLLKTVGINNRTVVILELPLQPWHISYGRIQRRLAKEFDAILIPKRFFVSVLSKKGASTDLAHLSQSGHEFMAETIWYLLGYSLKVSELSG